MGKNEAKLATSPTDVEEIKRKIEEGEVKVKGVKTTKNTANKERVVKVVKGKNGEISDEKIMSWLKAQGKAVSSTELRDGLTFKTRTQARRVMRRLAKTKVVRITTKQVSDKRAIFMFQIA